jgi:hypothetical protein
MEALKHQITYAIEQMTLQGVNLKTSSIGKLDFQGKNDLGSHDGLLKEYKKLGIQLKQLQLLEKRTREQLHTMKDEEREIMRDIQRFSSLDVSETFWNLLFPDVNFPHFSRSAKKPPQKPRSSPPALTTSSTKRL